MASTRSRSSATPKPLMFWVGVGLCGTLALVCLLMLGLFFTSGNDEILRATAAGQRITINTTTGEISGNARSSTPESPTTTSESKIIEAEESKAPSFDVGEESPTEEALPTVDNSTNDESRFVATAEEAAEAIPVFPRSATSLVEAPLDDLAEKSQWGILPKTGKAGSVARYYAREIDASEVKKPVIAIIVAGLGHNKAATESALQLPLDISLAFDPYAKNTPTWVESARNIGHEAWLMLPVQPNDFPASDPGPKSLLNDLKPEDNLKRLYDTLASFTGYVGVILPQNEVFTNAQANFNAIAEELKKRGVAMAAAVRPANSEAYRWFDRNPKMTRLANEIIDARLGNDAITARLNALESKAKVQGMALGMAGPYPLSMTMIDEWSKTLAKKGIMLVPASALLDM